MKLDTPIDPHVVSMPPEMSDDMQPVSATVPSTLEPEDRFRRLWELPPNLRCPVVGTCMRNRELRKILTKSGVRAKQYSSFQLHIQVMNRLAEEGPVSRKVDAALRRKYRDSLDAFGTMPEDRFMALWRERLKTGDADFVDLFYVSCVRRDLSEPAAIEIYGDIHMMGHAQTRTAVSAGRKLADERERAIRAEERLKRERERNHSLKSQLQAVNAEVREARHRITELSFSCASLRKCRRNASATLDGPDPARLRAERDEALAENRKLQKELNRVEREKRKCQIERFELRSIRDELSGEIETLIAQFGQIAPCEHPARPEACPRFDTCPKRILIVGGMTRIRHLYQALVESRGGVFDYHDGYMQNGNRDIDAQVRRSDVVICPVNCNSHGACRKIKHLCKKYDKPFKMLPSASLSAITEALHGAN